MLQRKSHNTENYTYFSTKKRVDDKEDDSFATTKSSTLFQLI